MRTEYCDCCRCLRKGDMKWAVAGPCCQLVFASAINAFAPGRGDKHVMQTVRKGLGGDIVELLVQLILRKTSDAPAFCA